MDIKERHKDAALRSAIARAERRPLPYPLCTVARVATEAGCTVARVFVDLKNQPRTSRRYLTINGVPCCVHLTDSVQVFSRSVYARYHMTRAVLTDALFLVFVVRDEDTHRFFIAKASEISSSYGWSKQTTTIHIPLNPRKDGRGRKAKFEWRTRENAWHILVPESN